MPQLTNSSKKYYADKLRQEHPELKDASDDEVLEVVKEVEIPDASPDEWVGVLEEVHGKVPTKGPDFAKIGQTAATVGILGVAALGAAKLRGKKGSFKTIAESISKPWEEAGLPEAVVQAIEKSSAPKKTLVTSPETEIKQEGNQLLVPKSLGIQPVTNGEKLGKIKKDPLVSEMAVNPGKPPREPHGPSSRANHQFAPENMAAARRLERDPEYIERLRGSGGGRRVTRDETWSKAFSSPPMTVEELAAWTPELPVNELDVARANILRTFHWDNWMEALRVGDENSANQIRDIILQIEPGYHNLSATPGRALGFMNVFRIQKEVSELAAELKAKGVPFEVAKREIDTLLQRLNLKDQEKKATGEMKVFIHKLEDVFTAFKLSSLVTHGINFSSNAATYVQRGLENELQAALHLSTGNIPMAKAKAKYAFGTATGFVSASRKFLKEYLSDVPPGNKAERWSKKLEKKFDDDLWDEDDDIANKAAKALQNRDLKDIPTKTKVLRLFSPFRLLGAVDNFWKTVIRDSEIRTKAYEVAYLEGRQGTDFGKRFNELLSDPPKEWIKEADEVAKEYTFQEDPDAVLKRLQVIQNLQGMRLIIPFVQTPYNITRFYARRSAFGVLSKKWWRDVFAGGNRRIEAISRLSLGLGLTGAAMAFVNTDHITGAYPKTPRERALWNAEGRRPWSIKIGNYWFQYNRLQPVGAYFATVAAINEAYRENKFDEAESKLGRLLGQLVSGPLDLPFLQGMSTAFDAIDDPEKSVGKFAQTTIQGLIPNILRDIRSQMDPTQRKPSNLKEAMMIMFPGMSQNVPAKLDPFGNEMTQPEDNFIRSLKMFSEDRENEKTKLMREIGWAPPIPRTEFIFEKTGDSVELEGEMKQQFLKDMGKAAEETMELLMDNPEFQKAPNEIKKKKLQSNVQKAQAAVRKQYEEKSGLYQKVLEGQE